MPSCACRITGGPLRAGTVSPGSVVVPPVVPLGWPTAFDGWPPPDAGCDSEVPPFDEVAPPEPLPPPQAATAASIRAPTKTRTFFILEPASCGAPGARRAHSTRFE